MARRRTTSARRAVHRAFEGTHPTLGRAVVLGVAGLILLSTALITLETMPALRGEPVLRAAGIIVAALFAVEYAARLWSAPDPLRYATSFWGVVDLLAAVPPLLLLAPDLQSVRALRLLRLLRLLKLARLSRAMDRIGAAFLATRDELAVFALIAAITIYLAAVGIHHFEGAAQPEAFGSIPAALWSALATLTTVGYGEAYPVTAGGRIFTGLVLLVGLGIVAVPAGVVTSALLGDAPSPRDPSTKGQDT